MTAAAGWYAAPDREDTQRYWDGTVWTPNYRGPDGAPLEPPPASRTGRRSRPPLTQAGQFLRIVALGLIAGGFYVGYAMHVSSIGADGTTFQDLAAARAVDCGTAWHQTFGSVACDQALSGRNVAAFVLLISGVVLGIGADRALRERSAG